MASYVLRSLPARSLELSRVAAYWKPTSSRLALSQCRICRKQLLPLSTRTFAKGSATNGLKPLGSFQPLPGAHRPASLSFVRLYSGSRRPTPPHSNARGSGNVAIYIISLAVFMIGGTYCAVPLYRVFCKATGMGGQGTLAQDATDRIEHLSPVKNRVITVRFNADRGSGMQWNFRPQQTAIKLVPGETALAFYTARNPTDRPIIGISTYTVVPIDAGAYFNKIQCFCFEEQRLNPHEEVDMPVFFYIDPEYADDPRLDRVNEITLSYTFFEAKEGMTLPVPGYAQPHHLPAASAAAS